MKNKPEENNILSAVELDCISEVSNIAMVTATTTLHTLLYQDVDDKFLDSSITTLQNILNARQMSYVALETKIAGDLNGTSMLLMNMHDAVIIAKLMMMQEIVDADYTREISEMEISAVYEAMNQMIGSSFCAISTMLGKFIDIAPPNGMLIKENNKDYCLNILDTTENIVQCTFDFKVGDYIDSQITQIFSIDFAKSMANSMMGKYDESIDKNESILKRYYELLEQKGKIEDEIDSLNIMPSKIFKFEGYYVDLNGDFDAIDDFQTYINNSLRNGEIDFFKSKTADILWYDDIDINQMGARQSDYDKYFK